MSENMNYSELPGLGPKNNQRVFYIASFIVLINFTLITAICSYTASMTGDITKTLANVNTVIGDLDVLLPDAKESLRIVKEMCKHENFTKTWGDIC
tara:strand:- start:8034 stop:8321 length:288 start_codon:yes stop_codon:yes gene_type:complete